MQDNIIGFKLMRMHNFAIFTKFTIIASSFAETNSFLIVRQS